MSFDILSLAVPLVRALADRGYSRPTPIQTEAIPVILTGRDLIGVAQTGTGKTAAFALPILNNLALSGEPATARRPRALVLSPTRELSGQIAESFRTYGRHLHITVAVAIGGVPIGAQVRALRKQVDVLVATPGRLIDLCNGHAVDLSEVRYFVLDEADRMLDMGFIRDVRRIAALVQPRRQTLLFSATMPPEIASLVGELLSNPATVRVAPPASLVASVDQRVVHTSRENKPSLLAKILKAEASDRVLVFARTKRGADRVVRGLSNAGIHAQAIHGNKTQGQRERVLLAFRTGVVRTLVATDIAARGIDVSGISHVINYDLPHVPESYVHRIGRTARAGNAGVAISFCTAEEVPLLRSIEKLIRRPIPMDDHERRPQPLPAIVPRPKGTRRRRHAGPHQGAIVGRNPVRRTSANAAPDQGEVSW